MNVKVYDFSKITLERTTLILAPKLPVIHQTFLPATAFFIAESWVGLFESDVGLLYLHVSLFGRNFIETFESF
jgi:hypothetical protein